MFMGEQSGRGPCASSCYETNLPVQRVMLRREDIHDVSDALPQPVEPNSDESQDEDQQIEFDSDGSTDSDGMEEQTRLNSHDEPHF